MEQNRQGSVIGREYEELSDLAKANSELSELSQTQFGFVLRDKSDFLKLVALFQKQKSQIQQMNELIHQKDLDIYQLRKKLVQKDVESMTIPEPAPKKKSLARLRRIISLARNTIKEFKRNGFEGIMRRGLIFFHISSSPMPFSAVKRRKNRILQGRKKIFGKSAKIAYVVPALKISGGVAVVLQHANRLLDRGYNVRIVTASAETDIDWFKNNVPVVSMVKGGRNAFDDIDIMIATHWSTAFWVDLSGAPRRIYFVQSDERRFNPENKAEIKSITETYRMDVEYMTEAKWIQRWLKEEFGKEAYYVPNGLDEQLFFHGDAVEPRKKKARVLIEGPINCWFKGMEDAYNAVKDLDCDLWIVSSDGKPKPGWRYDRFFDSVPMGDMRKVYSSCDVFLKMSRIEGFFGPPLEAMACECAVVVSKVTGYDEYIKNEYNALVVEQVDINGARNAVQRLIDDVGVRKTLVENGRKTAGEWTWNKSIDRLEKSLRGELIERMYSEENPSSYNYRSEMKRLGEGRR